MCFTSGPTVTNSRVSRGRQTQALVAQYLAERGWPDAKSRPASLPGKDIYDCGLLAPEVKATAKGDLTGALRQARANAVDLDVPFVVYRPSGYGPERIDLWVAAFEFKEAVRVLNMAGF